MIPLPTHLQLCMGSPTKVQSKLCTASLHGQQTTECKEKEARQLACEGNQKPCFGWGFTVMFQSSRSIQAVLEQHKMAVMCPIHSSGLSAIFGPKTKVKAPYHHCSPYRSKHLTESLDNLHMSYDQFLVKPKGHASNTVTVTFTGTPPSSGSPGSIP